MQARAEWRVPFSAALAGAGLGLALGAVYLGAGLSQGVSLHSRSERMATAAADGFTETALRQEAGGMDSAALTRASAYRHGADDVALARSGGAVQRLNGGPLASSRELDCLTQAVYFEARGESVRGQAAVAQVVLNRVRHPAFPKTVCAVVFQGAAAKTHGCQFSFACDGSMRKGREVGAWMRARQIAARALSGAVLSDVGSATHFHTTAASPGWPGMLRVAQVGLHVFYKFGAQPARAPAAAAPDRAVFASLPAPVELRMAVALSGKAAPEPQAPSAESAVEPPAAPAPATTRIDTTPVVGQALVTAAS